MKSPHLRILALKQAMLVCLGFGWIHPYVTEFKIGVDLTYMDFTTTNISFNKNMLTRFRECLCNDNELTVICTAGLTCRNENCKVSQISKSSVQENLLDQRQFCCFLDLGNKMILCIRRSTQEYRNYASTCAPVCQLKCAEIIWSHPQLVVTYITSTDITIAGNAPSSCNATLTSTTSTTSTTSQTTTTLIPRELFTSVVTHTQKYTGIFSTQADPSTNPSTTVTASQNGVVNGETGDSDSKMPIIVGVTISSIALLVISVGLLLVWRKRYKHHEHIKRKESPTVVAESHFDNLKKNDNSPYSNINSLTLGLVLHGKGSYETLNAESIDQYTVVSYSNGEFHHTSSGKPVFYTPGSNPAESNVYLNIDNRQESSEDDKGLINRINDVTNPDYALTDQNTTENTKQLCVGISKYDTTGTYSNLPKRRNPFPCEDSSLVFEDSRPVYYELESTTEDSHTEGQGTNVVDGTTGTTVNKIYSKLGDQSRNFKNPYNSVTGTVNCVTASNSDLSAVVGGSNFASEYCLASSVNNNTNR